MVYYLYRHFAENTAAALQSDTIVDYIGNNYSKQNSKNIKLQKQFINNIELTKDSLHFFVRQFHCHFESSLLDLLVCDKNDRGEFKFGKNSFYLRIIGINRHIL